MKRITILLVILMLCTMISYADSTEEVVLFENGFENGLDNWLKVYIESNSDLVKYSVIETFKLSGKSSLLVNTIEESYWELSTEKGYDVLPGQVIEFGFSYMTKNNTLLNPNVSFYTYDKDGNWLDLKLDFLSISDNTYGAWKNVKFSLLVGEGISKIVPVIRSASIGDCYFDNLYLKKVNDYAFSLQSNKMVIENTKLQVTFNTKTSLLSVLDKRNNYTWEQVKYPGSGTLISAVSIDNAILLKFFLSTKGIVDVKITLDDENPDLKFSLNSKDDMPDYYSFPLPFRTDKEMNLIIPHNEGLSIPVEDLYFEFNLYRFFDGNGLSMNFFGVTDSRKGFIAIIETPNDADLQIFNNDELAIIQQRWYSEKGKFGYERKITYSFLDIGGVSSIAKRYKPYVKSLGYTKTLLEKKLENPDIDKIVGSAFVCYTGTLNDLWYQTERNSTGLFNAKQVVSDMKKNGLSKITWVTGSDATVAKFLTSSNYFPLINVCLYQVTKFGVIGGTLGATMENSSYWPFAAAKDNNINLYGFYNYKNASILCTTFRKVEAIANSIKKHFKDYPYKGIYLDTTACSGGIECYDPKHPTTRTSSLNDLIGEAKYAYLAKLVVGSETGSEMFNPYCSFYLGMESIKTGQPLDSTRFNKDGVFTPSVAPVIPSIDEVPLNHLYRAPLWELVYHDAIVSTSHWSDPNNTITSRWLKRDLFDLLYGTSPNYQFNYNQWYKDKLKFKESYNRVIPVIKSVGYSEMTNFEYLTDNRDVQMTTFANGVEVIVNFGKSAFTYKDEVVIKPMDYKVYGLMQGTSILAPKIVKVNVNGVPVMMIDVQPFVESGRTYVPVRSVLEAYGVESIKWESPFVFVTRGDISLQIPIGEKYLVKNGVPVVIDTPALLRNGRVCLPIRSVIEALGGDVGWDEFSHTVLITSH